MSNALGWEGGKADVGAAVAPGARAVLRGLLLGPGPLRRLSGLRVFYSESVLHGAFVCAQGAYWPTTVVCGPSSGGGGRQDDIAGRYLTSRIDGIVIDATAPAAVGAAAEGPAALAAGGGFAGWAARDAEAGAPSAVGAGYVNPLAVAHLVNHASEVRGPAALLGLARGLPLPFCLPTCPAAWPTRLLACHPNTSVLDGGALLTGTPITTARRRSQTF